MDMASFRAKFGHSKLPPPPRTERADAPELIRKLLLDLMEERAEWDEDFEPYEVMCDFLNEVPENLYGSERQERVRHAVRAIDWPDVYELIAQAASEQETRVNDALAAAGIAYEFYGGEFHLYEPAAHEVEVADAEDQPLQPGLDADGRFKAPLEQYRKSLQFLRSMPPDTANAVASAVNALEGTVGVITGKKNISDGLKAIYSGERIPLAKSMEMLFAYGSTKDGVRHGARNGGDEIGAQEATYIVRAAGSAIAYLIAADYEQSLI